MIKLQKEKAEDNQRPTAKEAEINEVCLKEYTEAYVSNLFGIQSFEILNFSSRANTEDGSTKPCVFSRGRGKRSVAESTRSLAHMMTKSLTLLWDWETESMSRDDDGDKYLNAWFDRWNTTAKVWKGIFEIMRPLEAIESIAVLRTVRYRELKNCEPKFKIAWWGYAVLPLYLMTSCHEYWWIYEYWLSALCTCLFDAYSCHFMHLFPSFPTLYQSDKDCRHGLFF